MLLFNIWSAWNANRLVSLFAQCFCVEQTYGNLNRCIESRIGANISNQIIVSKAGEWGVRVEAAAPEGLVRGLLNTWKPATFGKCDMRVVYRIPPPGCGRSVYGHYAVPVT